MTPTALRWTEHGRTSQFAALPRISAPSGAIEVLYYLSLAYSLLAGVAGLSISGAGGTLLLATAVLCVWRVRRRLRSVFRPIVPLLACGGSLVLVQVFAHGESLSGAALRSFVTWMLGLLAVQALRLRPGFLHRVAATLFLVGAAVLPFITFSAAAVERARVDLAVGANLSHSGGLSEWFAFCAVYFAVLGAGRQQIGGRALHWVIAVGCLFVVGLTVSRGALLAASLAIAVALRKVLKRGAAPVFLLLLIAGVSYESGIFEGALVRYEQRGVEDTGRLGLWPAVGRRFLDAPVFGVGLSWLATDVPGRDVPIATPHNSFLYIALSSGLVPTLCFGLFWLGAFRRSGGSRTPPEERPFREPFLVFTLCVTTLGDLPFMSPWGVLALSVIAGPPSTAQTRRIRRTATAGRVRVAMPVPTGRRRMPRALSAQGEGGARVTADG